MNPFDRIDPPVLIGKKPQPPAPVNPAPTKEKLFEAKSDVFDAVVRGIVKPCSPSCCG